MQRLIRCDLLKIPHHGSMHIPTPLLDAFKALPQNAVTPYMGAVGRNFDENGRDLKNPFESKVRMKSTKEN